MDGLVLTGLDGDDERDFVRGPASAFARLFPARIGVVELNLALEFVALVPELCGKVGDGAGKGRRRISGGVSQPHIQTRIDTPWKRIRSSPCASRARSPIH
jgi:hypothetical protein